MCNMILIPCLCLYTWTRENCFWIWCNACNCELSGSRDWTCGVLCSNPSAVRVVRGVCELCHDYTGLCLHLYAWNVHLNTAVFLYSMLLLMLSKNWKYILNVVWLCVCVGGGGVFLCVICWQRFANGMDLYSLELFSVRDNEVAADVLR